MRKSVKKTAKKAVRKTTKMARRAKSAKPVERRVSAKRLIPRIEALEIAVDALKQRLAKPAPGYVLSAEDVAVIGGSNPAEIGAEALNGPEAA